MLYAPTIGGLPGIILDGGMRELAGKFEQLPGVTSEVFPWFRWKAARNKAIQLHRAGHMKRLAIAGHSWGCLKAIQFAQDVGKLGIKVHYIAAFDPTALPPGADPMAVPANVDRVDEMWAWWGVPASARLRSPAGAKGGKYIYPHNTQKKIQSFMVGHIALGADDRAHAIAVEGLRYV
jgi:hypothetical protein